MHSLPRLILLKSTPHSLSLTHTYTQALPLNLSLTHIHTRTCSQSHTRAVLSGAPLLDHSHLTKEVPAEGRESQSERETKGRRTVEGEERIGARVPAQGRRDPALCEEQKARDRRREEERGKKEEGEQETRSLSAAAVRVAAWAMHHPKACQPYLHTYLCSRYLFDSACCAVQPAGCPPVTLCESRGWGLG